MASLDDELLRRGSSGHMVLVGEAVLTKSVPDITDKLKDAVYTSGVARPKLASALELQQLEQQPILPAQPQAVIPGPTAEPTKYLYHLVSAHLLTPSPMAPPPLLHPWAVVPTLRGPTPTRR